MSKQKKAIHSKMASQQIQLLFTLFFCTVCFSIFQIFQHSERAKENRYFKKEETSDNILGRDKIPHELGMIKSLIIRDFLNKIYIQ